MKGVTLRSLLELPVSLKWFETGLSASESISHGAGPYRCSSLTCILTWVLSRLQQIENRLGLAVYLVLLVDGDDHVQEVNSVSLKVNLSCEFDGWINTVHGVQEGSEVCLGPPEEAKAIVPKSLNWCSLKSFKCFLLVKCFEF